MATCSNNTDFLLIDTGGAQVRDIKFTADRQTIEVWQIGISPAECTTPINSGTYVGVKIVRNNLVFTAPISGLTTNISSSLASNPSISIGVSGGVASIIGVDDIGSGFTVPQMNVRFDSLTNSVKFQI
jgi:hypothetical protein